jgi:glycosyltransferase involved in cell wall biosynthesis
MKVFVATHSYTGNGAAVMLLAVLEYWVKNLGWTVDVYFPIDSEVPEELARTGVSSFSSFNPKDYDFALVNTILSASYLETIAPHLPTVLWVHEGETVVWNSIYTPTKWREIFEHPRKIIFQTPWQSHSVFRSFLPNHLQTKVACVKNGLPSMPPNITPRPRSLGKKRIVFIGGVYARKRPQDLVDAILLTQRNDIECVFAGSTSIIDSLGAEDLAKLRGRPDLFTLVGEVDRLVALEYLAGADVFCLPSADESQPIAPLEAAALGIPCLLSDLPPYVGTWRHGVNCLMHPVGHVALLTHNLQAALSNVHITSAITTTARGLATEFALDRFLRHFTLEMPV